MMVMAGTTTFIINAWNRLHTCRKATESNFIGLGTDNRLPAHMYPRDGNWAVDNLFSEPGVDDPPTAARRCLCGIWLSRLSRAGSSAQPFRRLWRSVYQWQTGRSHWRWYFLWRGCGCRVGDHFHRRLSKAPPNVTGNHLASHQG